MFSFLTCDVKSNLVPVPSNAANSCVIVTACFEVICETELELFVLNFIPALFLFSSKFNFSSLTSP